MSSNFYVIDQAEKLKADKVLRVSAQELAKLKSLAADLQVVLENLVVTAEEIDSDGVKSLQSLDYIQQSLTALTSVMTDAAAHASPDWDFQALKGVDDITLADLKDRFKAKSPHMSQHVSDGHCDYF